MISRSKFAVWLALLLLGGVLVNYSFFRASLQHHSAALGPDEQQLYESPSALMEQAAEQHLNEQSSPRDLRPFDDDDVRRGATCRKTTVALEHRLPDIALNFTAAPGGTAAAACACARSVSNDVDHGRTLSHIMKRHYCANSRYALSTAGRPMRVVQVGANTGDNANDHLVNFLKAGVAQGVLLEPVPWIFRRLSQTYKDHLRTVRLVNAAMSEQDGNVSFVAPKEKSSGWLPQMGGLHLPPKTLKTLKKNGGLRMFDKINVHSTRFESILRQVGWDNSASPPDVFVVDAEGYDAVIVDMVLGAVASLFGQRARIPILQYEWKHIGPDARSRLWATLRSLGYCVMQVHYDDVAVHADALGSVMAHLDSCDVSFDLL